MSILWVRRVGNQLHPADDDSIAMMSHIPFGKVLRAEVKATRNGPKHRLWWAVCHRIANAIGTDPGAVADLLKIESGHCTTIKSKKYGMLHLPKSISWAKMEDGEFNDFFEKCVRIIQSEWGIARQDVLDSVADLLDPKAAIND